MEGVLHLVSGLVISALKTERVGESPAGNTLLALADRHIQALLENPRLEVAGLARALGVSRTRLYEAFAERGGIAAAIRDARLDRARLRLKEPADRHRTMEEVARGCGFEDYPTFTRAFRRRFGLSPREWRAS